MRDAQPRTIYLKDYRVPEFLIDTTDLHFELDKRCTVVTSKLQLRRNPASSVAPTDLVLDGQSLKLLGIKLNDKILHADQYRADPDQLVVYAVPDQFVLECVTEIHPENNTTLEGLYKSRTMFCTQCEAEGFRRICYYLDRPDVMSVFTVTLIASKAENPVLLSNGNLVASGDNGDGTHWTRWQDPFKKPCYLFALVAGNLAFIEDRFVTCSGRNVTLRIYVEEKDLDKCDHAMLSLKNAMRWDEDVYGREYDLDIFNIVAVDDFNMGAMENKSLNIFNTSCVLAKQETTTDEGFQRVEGVVAHEYFHNWSGNRVTCRDWFQLSLKEGFTVYRDAEFSAAMGSRTVKRVEDVILLRTMQFAEDSGPMAHPVRPDSYMEISNFYTLTVYEKGAEVVRMLANLLGPELFRRGCDRYFEQHDGQAVTCEDFVRAMEAVSGKNLAQFRLWYSQAGTPVLHVSDTYDAHNRRYTLTVKQHCPPSPKQTEKLPFHIPLAMGLLGDAGALALRLADRERDADTDDNTHLVLDITEPEQSFVFENIPEPPVPSLLRGFSAPVRLHYNYSRDDLLFLMSRDDDGFCRWEAAQQLGVQVLHDMMAAYQRGETMVVDGRLVEAYRTLLNDETLDKAMVALMLALPSEAYLAEISQVADVVAIHRARQAARVQIAEALSADLWRVYRANQSLDAYRADAEQIARRGLKNTCLTYLLLLEDGAALAACLEQCQRADNMTDELAALRPLINTRFGAEKAQALLRFYQRWHHEALVMNQWLAAQAASYLPGTLDRVIELMTHPVFDIKNPNKVRALIGTFCGQNAINFHHASGEGYRFLGQRIIELDKINPQVTARMLTPLTRWQKYPVANQAMMVAELRRIIAQPQLSRDVYEVVSKSLQAVA